ncbi:hypothetical protein DYBT9275_03348 [Dyadobacter sp. CECT 9275]|uniref:Uncharacterized protein n=2 Tax=Dyadobacter helix TaxID=2822344 RepID=A0A916JDW6_9BACT|nr:hypothetical protein DYBT9275_03348 [Dyadobacter sp. CECT 9275]
MLVTAFHKKTDIGVAQGMSFFRTDSKIFARSIVALGTVLEQVDSKEPETIVKAKNALLASRIAYKRIEAM